MRLIYISFISSTVLFCVFLGYLICTPEQEVTLRYYTKNIHPNIINKATKIWIDSNILFVQTSDEKQADIVIEAVDKEYMFYEISMGEQRAKTILINNSYTLSNNELTRLIAHEIGHFLGLDHSVQNNSIMNEKISLESRKVLAEDTHNIIKMRASILCRIYFYRLFSF